MFCFESVARYSEMGTHNHMTLTAVLNLFQDCCTFQSESLGAGISYLRQAKRAWVLASWQVVVCRYPELGEKLKTYTWPYEFRGFLGKRNFKIEDEGGAVIAYANSIWTYLDIENGHPAKVAPDVASLYKIEEPYDMECKSRKIALGGDLEPREPVKPGRSFLDTNLHVNNAKYILMAEEYLPEDFCVREMRAEYKKPAVLSDVIYPRVSVNGGKVLVSLEDEAGKPYAVVEFLEG